MTIMERTGKCDDQGEIRKGDGRDRIRPQVFQMASNRALKLRRLLAARQRVLQHFAWHRLHAPATG